MNERFKQIRKENNMTQTQFADTMGISQNYVAQMESGTKSPSDRLIADICRRFKVNENWLRTGEGDKNAPTDSTFASVCAEIGATDPILQNVIVEIWSMSEEDRQLMWSFLERLVNARNKKE